MRKKDGANERIGQLAVADVTDDERGVLRHELGLFGA